MRERANEMLTRFSIDSSSLKSHLDFLSHVNKIDLAIKGIVFINLFIFQMKAQSYHMQLNIYIG